MDICIDYLTVTFRTPKIEFLIDYFRLPRNELQRGYGSIYYAHGYYIPGVNLRWNTDVYGTVTDCSIDLSGRGCRYVESLNSDFDWLAFFDLLSFDLVSGQANITRIDLALDIKDHSVISSKLVSNYAKAHLYVSKAKSLPLRKTERETTTYFGSSKSDRMLRVYDKGLEQCLPDTNWTRFELQCRRDNALSTVLQIIATRNIGDAYIGQLAQFIRFIEPVKGYQTDIANNHRDRLQTASWWSEIVDGCRKLKMITKPDPDYTFQRLARYIETQTLSSLKAYFLAHDGDLALLLAHIRSSNLRQDQINLLMSLDKDPSALD